MGQLAGPKSHPPSSLARTLGSIRPGKQTELESNERTGEFLIISCSCRRLPGAQCKSSASQGGGQIWNWLDRACKLLRAHQLDLMGWQGNKEWGRGRMQPAASLTGAPWSAVGEAQGEYERKAPPARDSRSRRLVARRPAVLGSRFRLGTIMM